MIETHAARAEERLRIALTESDGSWAAARAAMAQAEATLELAEQQRIANLFYLARETHVDLVDGLDALGVTAEDIRAALGLKQ